MAGSTLAAAAPGRGVRVAVDAMGGDHGAAEVVPGALAYARGHPDDTIILVGDEAVLAGLLGDRPANVRTVHASQVVGDGRASRDRAAREEGRDDPRRHGPRPEGRGRRGGHGGPHRCRHGGRGPPSRPPARRGPAGSGGPDGRHGQPVRPARHRRQPGLHPREPRAVRPDGRHLQRACARGRSAAGGAALHRRGEGQGRRPHHPRDGAAGRDGPQLHRQRRGQGPDAGSRRTSSSATRSWATS